MTTDADVESGYRRGCEHGVAHALGMLLTEARACDFEEHLEVLHDWRSGLLLRPDGTVIRDRPPEPIMSAGWRRRARLRSWWWTARRPWWRLQTWMGRRVRGRGRDA